MPRKRKFYPNAPYYKWWLRLGKGDYWAFQTFAMCHLYGHMPKSLPRNAKLTIAELPLDTMGWVSIQFAKWFNVQGSSVAYVWAGTDVNSRWSLDHPLAVYRGKEGGYSALLFTNSRATGLVESKGDDYPHPCPGTAYFTYFGEHDGGALEQRR